MKYDYLIVGAGLFGAVVAERLTSKGYKVLVLEKRNHIAGNIYTEKRENINVHVYGAHIFHTSIERVWEYVNKFAKFNNYINSPLANFHGEMYHLPFNMNTFVEIWNDVKTPEDAQKKIKEEIDLYGVKNPQNLEEQAISMIGKTIYTKLIKEYTEKQWGRDCKLLPPDIIKRLPVRYTFDNNYFNDKYQGIPIGGYTKLVKNMLNGIDVILGADYLIDKEKYNSLAEHIIYTGPIDAFYDYCFGNLEYRSLIFKIKTLDQEDYQGHAVVNYTSHDQGYTRIIEHKYFENDISEKTIITEEYPATFKEGMEPYYPVNDEKNSSLLKKYQEKSLQEKNVYFGGRLGQYKYLDMDDTIEEALSLVDLLTSKK